MKTETQPINKFEQKRIDRLNSTFQKVLWTGRSEGGYLLIITEWDDRMGARFKYEKHVVGKRGGVIWIKKGNIYDSSSNQILDEGSERYYI